ncbi:carboxylesterase [Colletotrichum kahawae]|uniref:Carboxylic ester hydrolase n=1 Tax=Colletotrichum kahawae TaxID=34407 RepID=A0AAE0D9Y8_COLKA|nr:carboxylesterase [Colletotrichum kahawae]
MKHNPTIVLALICGFAVAEPSFGNWSIGQTVSTTSGRVLGHAAQDVPNVSEYLGIPYAAAPVGARRFQPPAPYNGSLFINGSDFGPGCMQPSATFPQSEDCLTINVWTKPQTGERSARQPAYSGRFFANDSDVVLMSINYRLGIFGFPGNPASHANLGLLDMRLALEWIQQNAESFGGDPSRISVFGQSAGAGMADFYAYAYASDPIANGFVLQSATVNGFPALTKNSTSARWFRITKAVGCGGITADHDVVTDCMKNRTSQQIFGAFSAEETSVARAGYLMGDNANEAGAFRGLQPNRSEAYWNDFNFRYYTCADAVRVGQAWSLSRRRTSFWDAPSDTTKHCSGVGDG